MPTNEISEEDFVAGMLPMTAESTPPAEEPTKEVSEPNPWASDFDGLSTKMNAFRDQAFGKMGGLERQLKELASRKGPEPTSPSIDMEGLKKAIEPYDPKLAEVLGQALADHIKFNPVDRDELLAPINERLGDVPLGTQIVLSHYDPEELTSIVPPTDEQGNLAPQSQRHKDFLTWYDLQSHTTQQALEAFGPSYVRALRKFEKWEGEQKKEKIQASGRNTQRLASGAQPSSNRRNGAAAPKTAAEAFAQAWNEED